MISKFKRVVLATAAALCCSGAFAAGKFVLIEHSPDSESWWNTVKNAVKQADEDYGVHTDWRNPPTGDLADMSRLVEQAAAQNYDGVIVTIADFSVLQGSIKKVIDKGIPVVTINSGNGHQSEQLGALMHVGQPEYDAGYAAGEVAKRKGVKSYLCINSLVTNSISWDRCKGFADAIGVQDYKKSTIDSGDDPTQIESKISAYLRQNPSTQAVLALGPMSAHPMLRYLEKSGRKDLFFATFDLSDDITRGIKSGLVQVAIDQQPYLQGYIPVAILATMEKMHTKDIKVATEAVKNNPKTKARFAQYGLVPVYGIRHISSGPGLVTKDSIAAVEKYAGQYR
jgi:simple sugar transport system substrate-binding protein